MAGPSGLKLGGLVEGMCPNVLMKEFFRSVNGRGKMAAKRPYCYQSSQICRRQTKIGRLVENIKTNKKVSWGQIRTQNGRGKMAFRDYRVLAYRLRDGLA